MPRWHHRWDAPPDDFDAAVSTTGTGDGALEGAHSRSSEHALLLYLFGLLFTLLSFLLLLCHAYRSQLADAYRAVTSGTKRCFGFESSGNSALPPAADEAPPPNAPPLTHIVGRICLTRPSASRSRKTSASTTPAASPRLAGLAGFSLAGASSLSANGVLTDAHLHLPFPGAIQVRRVVELYAHEEDARANATTAVSEKPPHGASNRPLKLFPITQANRAWFKHLLPTQLQPDALYSTVHCQPAIWISTGDGPGAPVFEMDAPEIQSSFNGLFMLRPILPHEVKSIKPSWLSLLAPASLNSDASSSSSVASSPVLTSTTARTSLHFGHGTSLHPARGDVKITYYEVPGVDATGQGEIVSILADVRNSHILPYTRHMSATTAETSETHLATINESTRLLVHRVRSRSSSNAMHIPVAATSAGSSSSSGVATFSNSSVSLAESWPLARTASSNETRSILYVDLGRVSAEEQVARRVRPLAPYRVSAMRFGMFVAMVAACFLLLQSFLEPMRALFPVDSHAAQQAIAAIFAVMLATCASVTAFALAYWRTKPFLAFASLLTAVILACATLVTLQARTHS